MEPKPQKFQSWFFFLAAIVVVVVLLLFGRSCRNEIEKVPPPLTDTLETDSLMAPPPMDEDIESGSPDEEEPGTPENRAPDVHPQGPMMPGTSGSPSGGTVPSVP